MDLEISEASYKRTVTPIFVLIKRTIILTAEYVRT